MAIPKVRGLLNKIEGLLKKTEKKSVTGIKKLDRLIGNAIETGDLKLKPKKGKNKGKAKYYWQYCEQEDVPLPVFTITPKEYFDATGAMSDEGYDGSGWLPNGFHELMESEFEFHGTREEAEAILRANPLFEEKEMFQGGGLE